jgi:hypothetical protein
MKRLQTLKGMKHGSLWILLLKISHWGKMGVKKKYVVDGSIQKNKVRLVERGFSKQPGIEYDETYDPFARMNTIRTFLALTSQYKWLVYEFDVKLVFLNRFLKEDIYIQQPQGYEVKEKEYNV